MHSSTGSSSHGSSPRMVRAEDVELRVVERGSGMPVLFIHGFPLDHSMWDASIARLSERYRVIAPDVRGFGASQVTSGTVTVEQMADDTAALLTALDVREPAVVCGLSMGGYVAFQFWRKCRARLRALVLCDTRSVADTPQAAAARLELVERLLAEGPEPVVQSMLPRLFAPTTVEKHPELVDRQRHKILAAAREGLAAALRGMAIRPDVSGELPRIDVPTLVVVGEYDAISTVDEMRGMAGAIPAPNWSSFRRPATWLPWRIPWRFTRRSSRSWNASRKTADEACRCAVLRRHLEERLAFDDRVVVGKGVEGLHLQAAIACFEIDVTDRP